MYEVKFIRGIPDADQLAKALERFDDIVAVEPCPIGEKGKINPHVTRYHHADGKITAYFHIGPLYYLTRWGTWESMRDVCTHKGNHYITIKPEALWKIDPQFLDWLEKRQSLFPADRGSYVAVDSAYGSLFKEFAKNTYVSSGLATLVKIPDPDPESTTMDGTALNYNSISWANVIAGNGIGSNDAGTAGNPRNRKVGSTFYCNREIFLFDTSSLGAGATISAATLVFRTTTSGAYAAESGLDAYVVASAPASNTAIANSDYENAFTDSTKYSDAVAFNATTNNTDETFTLTAGGLAIVSKTGVTKLGVRGDFDIDGTPDPASSNNNWLFYTSDNGANEPTLTVTYTTGGSTFIPKISMM